MGLLLESEFSQISGTAIEDICAFFASEISVPFTLLLASLLFAFPRRSGRWLVFSLRAH